MIEDGIARIDGAGDGERVRRAIVVVDVVESVRLMQVHEQATIRRWRGFVAAARTEVLPTHGGRLVKSLGDGLLLTFDDSRRAVAGALALQAVAARQRGDSASDEALHLRAGVHAAEIVVDELDVYGAGVNLAARLAGLAGPDEVVVSAAVRDDLVDGLDVQIHDLGHCFLKNLDAAVRAFRVGPRSSTRRSAARAGRARPTLLVLPPLAGPRPDERACASLVAHGLITQAGTSGLWNVISHLSSGVLEGRPLDRPAVVALMGANYLVHSEVQLDGTWVQLQVGLQSAHDEEMLHVASARLSRGQLLGNGDGVLAELCRGLAQAVVGVELQRARGLSLPSLEAYSILFRAVERLHHTNVDAVDESQRALEHLADRHAGEPEVHAWAARSQVMRVAQDASADPQRQASRARDHLRRAFDIEPRHPLALAVEGLVRFFIERDLDGAAAQYEQALAAGPNEALAWLFMASVHAHRENGAAALECAERASELSPLGPLDHYVRGVTAWARLAAGDAAGAEALAMQAMQTNCTHRPTYVTLLQAQALQGRLNEARTTAERLRALAPGFSVRRFLQFYPGGANPFAHRLGDAMHAAGIPH